MKKKILGVGITSATEKEVLEYLLTIIKKREKNIYVVTPNPEMLVLAQSNRDFKNALNTADLALCDGMQLLRAARFLGKPLQERIIGTNFVETVCKVIEDWPITVGFLGGRSGVAEKTAECLTAKYPKLQVVYVGQQWGEKGFVKAHHTVDILFVAFGAPKQELWMAKQCHTVSVHVMVGVGGAFDQIVHSSLRPPQFLHALGLGWLYRLIREPWRIQRQLKLFIFVWLILQEKFSPKESDH